MGSTEIERPPSRTFHDQRVSPITGVNGVLPVDHQDIVAGTADQGIGPWPTFEKVVAGSAHQRVVAGAAAGDDGIRARGEEGVLPFSTLGHYVMGRAVVDYLP